MKDRLVEILNHFELKAGVFQKGPLCQTANYSGEHNDGYIHLLERGSLRVTAPGHASLLLQEPALMVYMGPTEHRLIPEKGRVEMVCASFQFGAGLQNPLVHAFPDVVVLKLAEVPAMMPILNTMFLEAAEPHCGQQAVLDRLMEVILILVLRELMDQDRVDTGLLAGLSDPRLEKAITALHEQPARHWTLEELAQLAGMSRARFAVRFREKVQKTPGKYLSEWRLAVARSLLLKGKPLALVAESAGYANSSALSRAFRAQTGQSPGRWRRSQ